MGLSCVILAKNEQEAIGDCIESIKLLKPDEILVIDDGSTDDTPEIARKKGAKVISHLKKDFAQARNFALRQVQGEWVLYLDADERITRDLACQIIEVIKNNSNQFLAYSIPRVNYYLGKKWPYIEKITRLFKRQALKNWQGSLHESPVVEGNIGELKNSLQHFTHRSLSEMVTNTVDWSKIEAQLRFDARHPPVVAWRIFRVMATTFFDYYIRQGGWKVGTVGLIESIYQSFSIFITYARLWEIQQMHKARG